MLKLYKIDFTVMIALDEPMAVPGTQTVLIDGDVVAAIHELKESFSRDRLDEWTMEIHSAVFVSNVDIISIQSLIESGVGPAIVEYASTHEAAYSSPTDESEILDNVQLNQEA